MQFHGLGQDDAKTLYHQSKNSGCRWASSITHGNSFALLIFRQCPKCSSRCINIYQHARKVHNTTYRELLSGSSPDSKETMSELSVAAVSTYQSWLMTVDGTNLSQKTSEMYGTCMKKIVANACEGSLLMLNDFAQWAEPGGYLESLTSSLTPSSVATYLQALRLFMGFLQSNGSHFRVKAGIKASVPREAVSTIQRWHASLRRGRQEQRTTVVAKAQQRIPVIAETMKQYYGSKSYQ